MALCKSLLTPLGSHLRHHQFLIELFPNEVGSLKSSNLRYKEKYWSTVKVRNFRTKNVKPIKSFKTPVQIPGEALENHKSLESPVNLLFKPFLFTVAFSSVSIAVTAIWQYENFRRKASILLHKTWLSDKITHGKKKYEWRQQINQKWNSLSDGEKLFIPICFVNTIVYLAWKVKKFQPLMITYFCGNPFRKVVCWPMILSNFSHYNFFHLVANMYVLHSFCNCGVQDLGREQFLGLYLSAGVISSFSSYICKVLKSQHVLSMGASGAIMAMVAYICFRNPDSYLSIIILPTFTFSAGAGIKCMMGLDLLGVIRNWQFFDHAAHLGGALCGLGWYLWGNTYIWKKREPLLHWWHELRTTPKFRGIKGKSVQLFVSTENVKMRLRYRSITIFRMFLLLQKH